MPDCSIAQTSGIGIVFFARNIGAGFIQILQRLVDTAAVIRLSINRWMIVQILAVIVGCLLDFGDGRIDLANGLGFIRCLRRISGPVFEEPARCA